MTTAFVWFLIWTSPDGGRHVQWWFLTPEPCWDSASVVAKRPGVTKAWCVKGPDPEPDQWMPR